MSVSKKKHKKSVWLVLTLSFGQGLEASEDYDNKIGRYPNAGPPTKSSASVGQICENMIGGAVWRGGERAGWDGWNLKSIFYKQTE